VNFITAHDGFTLHDTVAYNEKHNDANGEENRDGSSNNRSFNCGAEGPTDDPAILELRARQMRNMLATLIFSQGTPMMLAGDEFGRTQNGNNNAYCQDNEISWVNWDIDEAGKLQTEFTRKLIGLRNQYPILHRNRFMTGAYDEELGLRDVLWVNPNGHEMQGADWEDDNARCLGMLMDGRSQATGLRQMAGDPTLLLVLNGYHDVVDFHLPQTPGGKQWRVLIDTNAPQREPDDMDFGHAYQVTARSLLLFLLV
jgi:glycogen operon protein